MVNTIHRGYPLPDIADTVAEEFYKFLNSTLPMVDGDIHVILQALAQRAALIHGHAISEVEGLTTALEGKMAASRTFTLDELTDTSGAFEAPDNYVLLKISGHWVAVSFSAAVGAGGGVAISQVNGLDDELNSLANQLSIHTHSINDLTNVDIVSDPPAVGEGLVWDGTNYVPGPSGGGVFFGNFGQTGDRFGDIFRANAKALTASVTIPGTANASAAGPLTVNAGVTLTVAAGGTLVIV